MEVTDDNLATLANYLQQTLNPDPNVRRPGKYCFSTRNYLSLHCWTAPKDLLLLPAQWNPSHACNSNRLDLGNLLFHITSKHESNSYIQAPAECTLGPKCGAIASFYVLIQTRYPGEMVKWQDLVPLKDLPFYCRLFKGTYILASTYMFSVVLVSLCFS